MSQLDKVDAQIVDSLQADGRLSNAKLAERLGMSEAICWRRHRRLEELGVINRLLKRSYLDNWVENHRTPEDAG